MLCYSCAEQGTDHMLDSCHHDTWTARERPSHAGLLSRS